MELKEVKTIGIVGVGFMGGSLALALKEKFKNIRIIGYARSQRSFEQLKEFRGLDKVEKSLAEVAGQADVLALAAPVNAINDYLEKIEPFLKPKAVVFDLGSTKKETERVAAKFLSRKVFFVGCHPFCGSEKSGFKEARPDLYQGALCFVTSDNEASLVVEKIWRGVGSRIVRISPEEHDKIVCAVSHFPHLACFSLLNTVSSPDLKFSSSGFKDLTRIASSPAALWTDIFLTNKDKIITAISQYSLELEKFRQAIESGDKKKLEKLIREANQKREKLINSSF